MPEAFIPYQQFVSRVNACAEKHNPSTLLCRPSIPAPVDDGNGDALGLLAYVYSRSGEEDNSGSNDNQLLGRVLVHRDEAVDVWLSLEGQIEKLEGPRFGEFFLDMTDVEKNTFLETYYQLLTLKDGPLWTPFADVDPQRWADLNHIFNVFVELPLLPYYQKHCTTFFESMEVAG